MAYGAHSRIRTTVVFFVVLILVILSLVLGYFLAVRMNKGEMILYVTVAPKVCEGDDFNYLPEGGAFFVMNKETSASTFENNLNTEISRGQKVVFNYTLRNSGDRPILYQFDIIDEQVNNCTYSYKIGAGTESDYSDSVLGEVASGEIQEIMIFINIKDPNLDCEIKGRIELNVAVI